MARRLAGPPWASHLGAHKSSPAGKVPRVHDGLTQLSGLLQTWHPPNPVSFLEFWLAGAPASVDTKRRELGCRGGVCRLGDGEVNRCRPREVQT